jgi:hypothetical protein
MPKLNLAFSATVLIGGLAQFQKWFLAREGLMSSESAIPRWSPARPD